jgi:hypothetical protein
MKQSSFFLSQQSWIASRSLSSGARSRDPLARMTVYREPISATSTEPVTDSVI